MRERCDLDAFESPGQALYRALAHNSPEAVRRPDRRAGRTMFVKLRRLYSRPAATAAIYYGLGVTEHSQGSTTVMAMANLAMATGNIGKLGAGVNPLRGQNNVQGACDMGSFPHEFTGYRHVSDDAARSKCSSLSWGVRYRRASLASEFRTCSTKRSRGISRRYISRVRISRSPIPIRKHVTAGLRAMECVIVQDLFLNETAKYAHVFLPGSSFLEKDGTFTNAERRINRVRKVMAPMGGLADWEATIALLQCAGLSR